VGYIRRCPLFERFLCWATLGRKGADFPVSSFPEDPFLRRDVRRRVCHVVIRAVREPTPLYLAKTVGSICCKCTYFGVLAVGLRRPAVRIPVIAACRFWEARSYIHRGRHAPNSDVQPVREIAPHNGGPAPPMRGGLNPLDQRILIAGQSQLSSPPSRLLSNPPSPPDCWPLSAGCWLVLLSAGCWLVLLSAGCWLVLLSAGCWLL
jgi:hypothetical protein